MPKKRPRSDSLFSSGKGIKFFESNIFEADPVVQEARGPPKTPQPPPKRDEVKIRPPMPIRQATHNMVRQPRSSKMKLHSRVAMDKVEKETTRKALGKKKLDKDVDFCQYDVINVPSPIHAVQPKMEFSSPSASAAAVAPRKLTLKPEETPSIPPEDELKERQPKTGIFLNESQKEDIADYDSYDYVVVKTPRPDFEAHFGKKKKEKKKKKAKDLKLAAIEEEGEGEGEGEFDLSIETIPEDIFVQKVQRRRVARKSRATSYQSKDIRGEEEEGQEGEETESDLEILRTVGTLAQKFRRESEVERYKPPLKRKFKRGTLQSHSFTKFTQPTMKNFFFGSKPGTMHQGDAHFSDVSRNRQGICMPVAAYCYALMKHPNKWMDTDIDRILEIGNDLYLQSYSQLHNHDQNLELDPTELQKYCFIFDKKVRFQVSEPEVTGMIRSEQRNVFNISKGLKIFFGMHKVGIFQTYGLNVALWRDSHFYFFDATPRTKDLYPDQHGTAIMANFYDTASITSVFLDRFGLGNWPFVIYSLNAYKIVDRYAPEDKTSNIDLENTRSNYNILDDVKAVVQGSFDLADKCFDFSRNKQALPMAVTCLVYSKITPPSAWHKTTIDKIMIIGNQLYLECMEVEKILDITLEHMPAAFTIGPYIVEIYIKANRFGDLLYKKSKCLLLICLEKFFQKNSNAIVEIGKFTLAIWKQRKIYYCFDPYSRDIQGYICRNGVACVSMHANLDSLIATVSKNFTDRDLLFYIHALVVCKIHRDPTQAKVFPKHLTMNDLPMEQLRKYTMKKSEKPATKKPVTVDFTNISTTYPDIIEPEGSLIEVESKVESLAMDALPQIPDGCGLPGGAAGLLKELKETAQVSEKVADLDSPSLSDTQIEPPRPESGPEDDEIMGMMDFGSYELTQEELELMRQGGEAGRESIDSIMEAAGDAPAAEGSVVEMGSSIGVDGEDNWYTVQDMSTSIGSKSLASRYSREMNTDLDFLRLPTEVLRPPDLRRKHDMRRRRLLLSKEVPVTPPYPELPLTQSEELLRESNFLALPDASQIVRGTQNIAQFGEEDIEFFAPFVCIMATAVCKKYTLLSWTPEIVDYVLQCGQELYKVSKLRYDQVSRLEIPKVTLGQTDFSVSVEYIFDTYMKENIVEMALEKVLFKYSDAGIFVTPMYSCALIYRNHLYYMYDPYGNNEVGLSEGLSNEGTACIVRFKNIRSMVQRILYNKSKREGKTRIEYTRFVLSSCLVTQILPPKGPKKKCDKRDEDEDLIGGAGEGGEGGEDGEPPPREDEIILNRVGYQKFKKALTITGNKGLEARRESDGNLKPDHFTCLCACLMLIECPIAKWDTKKVDYTIEHGLHIFSHAVDLQPAEKRIIKNILIGTHYFDVIVKPLKILNYKDARNLEIAIDTLFFKKHTYFMVQLGPATYVVHKSEDGLMHLFDPYGVNIDGSFVVEGGGPAGWIQFDNIKPMRKRIEATVPREDWGSFIFYTFEVASLKKAPKSAQIEHTLQKYEVGKPAKSEILDKPFFEDWNWLMIDPIPWSRRTVYNSKGVQRDKPENKWHNWDIEYPADLWSLVGNLHQTNAMFPERTRGKQTLANLVGAIGMTKIYELSEWNAAIMDSILVNGNSYFEECVESIGDEDYELNIEDLLGQVTIFPYTFKAKFTATVDGVMFVLRKDQFNLYKALRYFFEDWECRFGIIIATKNEKKRRVAFGKTKELEYFMYDCEALGPPMFVERKEVAYVLRMTTLNRLLHAMTLTLRGGSFYIYDVEITDFSPIN